MVKLSVTAVVIFVLLFVDIPRQADAFTSSMAIHTG
jgi:hypothetical protein